MKHHLFSYKHQFLAALSVPLIAVLGTTSVTAQDALKEAESDSSGPMEEVIVTTQRRAESLQSVPLSITAFSGEALRQQRIASLKDISERTPGLTIGEFKPAQPQIFIRGIGSNEDGAAADQSVIVFIDEVYIGRAAGMVSQIFDLERVEVLRGPQGTLFGKNVVGGAINYVTKKPTEVTEATVEATYGNLNANELRGYASGELAENLYGKVAFSSRKRDGYMKSVVNEFPEFFPTTQPELLDEIDQLGIDTQGVRGAIRWLASDDLEFNFTADYVTVNENGTARYYLPGPGNGGDFYRTDSAAINNYESRIRTGLFDDPGIYKLDSWGVTGRIDYSLKSDLRFTSLSSFREVDSVASDILGTRGVARVRLSTGAAPFTFVGDNPAWESSTTITQEFRLMSDSDGPLEWVAGLYYLYEEVDRNETSNLGLVVSDGAGGLIDILPQVLGGDLQHNETNSYAAFAQATYSINDKLRVTAGARYTYEKKDLNRVGTAGGLVVTENYLVDTGDSWKQFTPKATIDYQLTDDKFIFFSVSKGFKSGGYQGLAPTAFVAAQPFDPETAWLYELGLKSEWLENRLRLNASAFYMDYVDLQVVQSLIPEESTTGTPVLFTSNAADAEIKGVELEFTFAPVDTFALSGTYAYLDTAYSNFFVPDGFQLPVGSPPLGSREGNRLRRAPKHSYTLLVDYSNGLSNGGYFNLQANVRYSGRNYGDADNLEYGAIPAHTVVGARIAYEFPGNAWEVALWADNLLDKDYFLNNFPNVGSGWTVPAAPRTYGITVSWRM